MIEPDKRKAVFMLHQEGMSLREIARRLQLSRNTVRQIIVQGGLAVLSKRPPKIPLDEEMLRQLYDDCDGWIQRVHEKLVEEKGMRIAYPTLVQRLRKLGISQQAKVRCARVPDQPGSEFQHDTSPYVLAVGGQRVPVVGSMLYLRYSKRRYLRFYRSFTRFAMQCFLHEGLMHWGYAAPVCVIDNTNLARLRGTGAAAVMAPEMDAFSARYAFRFLCHEVGHCDRKAGEERSFWTVETNFFPGRTFASLEDLNAQALEWATVRMEQRRQGKIGLIPAQAFAAERAHLLPILPHLLAPYRAHERQTDQYGYVAFGANYYWVPGTGREPVQVLEYADRIKLYLARELLIEYPLAADGVKNAQFQPAGQPAAAHNAKSRRDRTQIEEKHLRQLGETVGAYLDFALPQKGIQRHRLVRQLWALSRRMTPELFTRCLARAQKFGITTVATLESIARVLLQAQVGVLPEPLIDETFRERAAYEEGSLTDPPDFSPYQDDD